MSVIIRLQNLPWSANAADIRAYFNGLSIPEGGVHIVGGEQGDAFIAFSTDEDARQAMLRDGGKLKEVKIKLFLSSRTEMLRIIEQARQQTLNLQTIMQTAAAQPVPAPLPVPTPQPQAFEPVPESKENNKDEEGERTREEEDHRRERRDRERSGSRERGVRSRDRERGRYNRDRDGRDSRRRRERSKSRERYRRRSRSRERNRRDKEGGARGSKRRDSDSDEKGSNPSREPPPPSHQQQQPQQHQHQHQQQAQAQLQPSPVLHNSSQLLHHHQQNQTGAHHGGLAAPGLPLLQQQHHQLQMQQLPSLKPALLPDPVLPAQLVMAMQKEMTPPAHVAFHQVGDQDGRAPPGVPYRRDNWGPVPPHAHPHAHAMRHPHADPKFGQVPGYAALPNYHHQAGGDYRHRLDGWGSPAHEDENDACIEIHGLPLNATYVDVKRLFEGLTIPPDGIKMINDNHGNRTGIAYVRFSRPGHKKLALNQNGKKVRSSIVEVLSLREAIYKTAVDNFKPDKDGTVKSDDMDIDNGENAPEDWKKENDVRKTSYHDPRTVGRNAVGKTQPKTNDVGRKEKAGSDRVVLKGLPPQAGDRDVLDLFSELGIAPLHIEFVYDNLGQPTGDAYCTFESPEEADKALSKNKTNMGRQTISVFSVTREETERVKGYRPEPYVPHHYRPPFGPMRGGFNPRMEGGYMEPGPGHERPSRFPDARFAMGDKMGVERGRGRGRGRIRMGGPPPPPAPPRRPHTPARPTSPYIDGESLVHFGKPGCVVALENIHFKADIDEIMEFFQGFRVGHEDVIRRFDENGRPTGDARVALESPQEALRAARTLSFKPIRGRPVKLAVMQ